MNTGSMLRFKNCDFISIVQVDVGFFCFCFCFFLVYFRRSCPVLNMYVIVILDVLLFTWIEHSKALYYRWATSVFISRVAFYIYLSFYELFYICLLFWPGKSFWIFYLPWVLGSPTDCCLLVLTDPASASIPSLFVGGNADQVKSNTVSEGFLLGSLSSLHFTCGELWLLFWLQYIVYF